jgi:hypothetical protein
VSGDDVEAIDGWTVFGRGASAGARFRFPDVAAQAGCEVRVYVVGDRLEVEIPSAGVRMFHVSLAVLVAVEARSKA